MDPVKTIEEEFQLPRGMGYKALSETIAGFLARIRVKEVTVTQNGKIRLVRVQYPGDPPEMPETVNLNPLFSAYDHWGTKTLTESLAPQPSLLQAALEMLLQCDRRDLAPLGFLCSPHHLGSKDRIRPTLLGVPVTTEERCERGRLVLLAGIDPDGGLPASTASFFCIFEEPQA